MRKGDIRFMSLKGSKVRIAAIDPTKLLRAVANVRFGEAAPQRRDHLRMSALGRDFVDDFGSFPKTEL